MFIEMEKPIARYNNIELYSRKLVINDVALRITKKEESFLEYMINNADKALSREDILKNVWNGVIVTERSVDTLVCKIKEKLPEENKTMIRRIATKDSTGYMFGNSDDENYTRAQHKIIHMLKNSPETVLIKDMVVNTHYEDTHYNRMSLRVIIYKLRKKLPPGQIITEKNQGYRWNRDIKESSRAKKHPHISHHLEATLSLSVPQS